MGKLTTKKNEMFTDEEVRVARAVRDAIIKENVPELISIYMAGEIVMWDDMRIKNNIVQSDVIKSVCEHKNFEYRDFQMMNQCLDCEKWLD